MIVDDRGAKALRVVRQMVEAYDYGGLQMSSPEIGDPENEIPYHPWHEEMMHYARLALEPSAIPSTSVTPQGTLSEKDAEIERLRAVLEIIAGSSDRLQALQARAALDNIGPNV